MVVNAAAMKRMNMYYTANSNELLPETYIKLRIAAFRPRTY